MISNLQLGTHDFQFTVSTNVVFMSHSVIHLRTVNY